MSKKYRDNLRIKVSLSQKWTGGKLKPTDVFLDVRVCYNFIYMSFLFHFAEDW